MSETPKKLKPGVYHGARPVRSMPIFNHEYTVVVPKHAKRLDPKLQRKMRTVNGQRMLVSGAYKTKGSLKGKLADVVDVAAARKGVSKLKLVSTSGSTQAARSAAKDSKNFKGGKYPGLIRNIIGRGKNSNSYARSQIEKLTKKKMKTGYDRTPGSDLRVAFATQLAAKVDEHLQQFAEIPLRDKGWGDGHSMGPPTGHSPSLDIYSKEDPGIHKLPNTGRAMINYRIRRKTTDVRDDGTERYGADIKVDSIEAVPEPQEFDAIVEESIEFGSGVLRRSATKLLKTRKSSPLIKKVDGEFLVKPRGAAVHGSKTYYADSVEDARGTAAAMLKKQRKNLSEIVEESIEFDSKTALFKDLPDDWEVNARERAKFDKGGNMLKHKRTAHAAKKGKPSTIFGKPNAKGEWKIDQTFGRSPSRDRRKKAVAVAGGTAAAGYIAGKHGGKIVKKLKGLVNLAAIVEASINFEGRSRDGGGRYAPGQNVSSGEMSSAYGLDKKKVKKAAVVGGAAGLVTAGVLGRKKLPGILGQRMARMAMRD